MITHYLKFNDEAAAAAALPDCRRNDQWRSDFVDAGFQLTRPDDQGNDVATTGFHINVMLPALDPEIAAKREFIWAIDEAGATVAGTPIYLPKRCFAGTVLP
jgi:hypothetical protein